MTLTFYVPISCDNQWKIKMELKLENDKSLIADPYALVMHDGRTYFFYSLDNEPSYIESTEKLVNHALCQTGAKAIAPVSD